MKHLHMFTCPHVPTKVRRHTYLSRAGDMALVVKCLSHKPRGPSSIPRIHFEGQVQ
jgi:hypothetical protein